MTVEVLRSFDDHAAGDIVDASGWLWAEQLIQQRYVRPIYAAPKRKRAASADVDEAESAEVE